MDVTWGARGQEAGLPMARVQPGVSRGRRRGAVPGGVRLAVHVDTHPPLLTSSQEPRW